MEKPKFKSGKTVISITKSFIKFVVVVAIGCVILHLLGVDVKGIFASLGIVALIIGFGAESLIADMVTGVFMLFENQYNIGDIVEVSGFRGRVESIGIRTTRLRDSGDNVKIINNSQMTNVLNRSEKHSVAVSDIGIAYETSLRELEEILPEMLEKIYENVKSEEPELFENAPKYSGVQQLGASAIVLRFVVETNEQDIFKATRRLNRELLLAFQDADIKIPYNQLEVYSK